jgi:hypothetical protein
VAGAAAGAFSVGVRYGTFAAADTDPYGYISEADALSQGRLQVDQRSIQDVPWPGAEATFSPPGWRPSSVHGFIVPIYSPGLPIVMAALQRLLGRQGVFYAVPMLGALGVLAIGWLGITLHGRFVGASSALLLATSPTFLRHVVQPVSDVPTMAWWTVSVALALARGDSSIATFGAGLAASMAILTRPNLLPLALVVGALVLIPRFEPVERARHRVVPMLSFLIGVLPGGLSIAFINQLFNGSPFLSGYGTLSYLYRLANIPENLDRYPRWLWQQESPLIYLAVLSPFVIRWRATHRVADRAASFLLAFALVVLLLYLPYSAFGREEWDYLRFILPGIAVLIVLSTTAAVGIASSVLRSRARIFGVLVPAVAVLGMSHVASAVRTGAFVAAVSERRYADTGRFVALTMPRDAVFISGLHSGTIRYYSNRLTIRYDLLDPAWLDRAIAYLQSRGHHPYIVVEEDEEPIFKSRFAAASSLGALDWPPSAERFEPVHVRIYDPSDRARYLAGEPVITGDIGLVGRPRLSQRR